MSNMTNIVTAQVYTLYWYLVRAASISIICWAAFIPASPEARQCLLSKLSDGLLTKCLFCLLWCPSCCVPVYWCPIGGHDGCVLSWQPLTDCPYLATAHCSSHHRYHPKYSPDKLQCTSPLLLVSILVIYIHTLWIDVFFEWCMKHTKTIYWIKLGVVILG